MSEKTDEKVGKIRVFVRDGQIIGPILAPTSTSWAHNISLPVCIFNNSHLSALETVSKYLKEDAGLNYKEISDLTNRDERTIWGAYAASQKKMPARLDIDYSQIFIPLSVIADRRLSILETITAYLKEELFLKNCKIACLLNRNDRTIWTVYNRAKKKRGVAQ